MKRHLIKTLLATTMLVVLPATPAAAQSIEDLKAQLALLSEKVEKLEAVQTKIAKKAALVKKAEPAFALASNDGLFEFNLRGRIYTDYVNVSDKDNTQDISGTEFRTARIGIEGKAWKDVKYKFEADFAGNAVTVKDAYMQYKTSFGAITVGQFKTPNSLDESTSSRHTALMERASFTDAFSFARQTGIMWSDAGKNWTAKVGVFKGSMADDGQGDTTFAARATYGDTFDGGTWLVGSSVRYREIDGQQRFRQRPHVHLSDRFVNTGSIGNGKDFFVGGEAGVQFGSFHAAAEYGTLSAKDAGINGDNASFGGGYIELGYFLTGEKRPLKLSKGAWDRPKVNNPVHKGGMGALAINARYDILDLSDEGIFGGEQDTWILGANWYLNRHARIMLNYSHSSIDNAFAVEANGADGENSVDAIAARFQIDW